MDMWYGKSWRDFECNFHDGWGDDGKRRLDVIDCGWSPETCHVHYKTRQNFMWHAQRLDEYKNISIFVCCNYNKILCDPKRLAKEK